MEASTAIESNAGFNEANVPVDARLIARLPKDTRFKVKGSGYHLLRTNEITGQR